MTLSQPEQKRSSFRDRHLLKTPELYRFAYTLRPTDASDDTAISVPHLLTVLIPITLRPISQSGRISELMKPMVQRLFAGQDPTLPLFVDMEVSVHECPRRYYAHLAQSVFPSAPLDRSTPGAHADLLMLPTFQYTGESLLTQQPSATVEMVKNTCLERFFLVALTLCCWIQRENSAYWFDFVDPSTGQSVLHDTSKADGVVNLGIYSEVDAAGQLLGYDTSANVGCCRVLKHPKWNGACYPATMFTNAPRELVLHILSKLKLVRQSSTTTISAQ